MPLLPLLPRQWLTCQHSQDNAAIANVPKPLPLLPHVPKPMADMPCVSVLVLRAVGLVLRRHCSAAVGGRWRCLTPVLPLSRCPPATKRSNGSSLNCQWPLLNVSGGWGLEGLKRSMDDPKKLGHVLRFPLHLPFENLATITQIWANLMAGFLG